jgi:hypothetical protein
LSGRHPCPCCGFLTLAGEPPGTYELCPVCFWEDDGAQWENPDQTGSANRESLRIARANFRALRASSRSALPHVRRPRPYEIPNRRSVGAGPQPR